MDQSERTALRAKLIADAQRAGFEVKENEDGTGWLVVTPRAFRSPSQELGDYPTRDRAWMGAANILQQMETE